MKTITKTRLLIYISLFLLILHGHNFLEPGDENYHKGISINDLVDGEKSIKDIFESKSFNKGKVSILIEKTDKRLTVYYDGSPIKSYPAVFGFNPVDDKRMEGDGCTPEGIFKVKNLYPHDKWSCFILLNYPTEISRRKHILAKRRGNIPGNTYVGGEIGIHGVPGNSDYMVDDEVNWTAGCISLKRDDIRELYNICNKGTIVEILH